MNKQELMTYLTDKSQEYSNMEGLCDKSAQNNDYTPECRVEDLMKVKLYRRLSNELQSICERVKDLKIMVTKDDTINYLMGKRKEAEFEMFSNSYNYVIWLENLTKMQVYDELIEYFGYKEETK